MKKLLKNNDGNLSIIALYIMTLLSIGALYTLFFIEFAIPNLAPIMPESDFKDMTLTIIWGIPIIITVVSSFAVLKNALKRTVF